MVDVVVPKAPKRQVQSRIVRWGNTQSYKPESDAKNNTLCSVEDQTFVVSGVLFIDEDDFGGERAGLSPKTVYTELWRGFLHKCLYQDVNNKANANS